MKKILLLLALLASSTPLPAQVDYDGTYPWSQTTSYAPDNAVPGWFYNLGITGLRVQLDPAAPRTLVVKHVFANTPAAPAGNTAHFIVGDVITGVEGLLFTADHQDGYGMSVFGAKGPIREFGIALDAAQGSDGILSVTRLRSGTTTTQNLSVGTTYGKFSPTFPSNCPKSDLILSQLLTYLRQTQTAQGHWDGLGGHENHIFAGLALLSDGSTASMTAAGKLATYYKNSTTAPISAGDLDNWKYLAASIYLSEYYYKTNDATVLAKLNTLYSQLLTSQYTNVSQIVPGYHGWDPTIFGFGGWGHNPGYEGYGPISMLTGQGALALSMMKRLGVNVDRTRLDAAFAFLVKGTGANNYVWYGDSPNGGPTDWADPGRTGASAIANWMSPYSETAYAVRAIAHARFMGDHPQSLPDTHGSPTIGMAYAAMGTHIDPPSFRKLLDDNLWWFSLAHTPEGNFYYQPNRDNAGYGSNPRFQASSVAALILSLPKRNLMLSERVNEIVQASFSSPPAAISTTAIVMTATTVTTTNGPTEYLFTETSGNPGATNSTWQTSASYTDSGLLPGTQYSYTVTVRDALGIPGPASASASATTLSGGPLDVMSVNFFAYGQLATSDYNSVTLEAGESAGVGSYSISGWQNYQVPWGLNSPAALFPLTSNLGATAALTLIDTRNGSPYNNTPNPNFGGSGDMMDSHANGTEDPYDESAKFNMTISSISYPIYDLVVYLGSNQAQFGDGTGKLILNNGVVRDFKLTSGKFNGFVEISNATTPGNYIVFRGLTTPSVSLKVWGNGFNHIGPAGFQIVKSEAASADTTPPAIVTFNPADGSSSVIATANLVATFSENISIGTGNITLKNLSDGTQTTIPVTDTAQVLIAGAVLTINPASDLVGGKNYAIQIATTAVKDLANNPFAGIADDTIWNLATANAPGGVSNSWNIDFGPGSRNYTGLGVAPGTGTTWNYFSQIATNAPLVDSAGSVSGVSLTLGSNISVYGNGAGDDLLWDYLYNINNTTSTTGLSGLTPNAAFSLYLYGNGDNVAQCTTFTLGAANGGATGRTFGSNRSDINATFVKLDGTVDSSGNINFTWTAAPSTTQYGVLNGLQLLVAGSGTPDTTPPSPSPMAWSSVPTAASTTSITMTAVTASDASGVEYRFTNVNLGANSPWQNSPVYIATGLSSATSYAFTVQARDKSPAQNTTTASASASATTQSGGTLDAMSVNFFVYGGLSPSNHSSVTLETGESAGVGPYSISGWQNYQVPWGLDSPAAPFTLTSNLGASAILTLNDTRNGATDDDQPNPNFGGNGDLMDSHANGTEDPYDESAKFHMTVSNIPYPVYDLIVYLGVSAGQFGDGTGKLILNGGVVRDFKMPSGQFAGFVEITNTTTPGNYIIFRKLRTSTLNLKVWGNGFNHIGPAGFQIVKDTTGVLPPGPASNPTPMAASVGHAANTDLSWTAGADAVSRNIYFGTNPAPSASELRGNQTATTFDPGLLANGTYYWRIDEVNPDGTTTGPVWSFLVGPPAKAFRPMPWNAMKAVATNVGTLQWVAGQSATTRTHDVYFGTDSTPDADEFRVNQSGTTYNPGPLAAGVTYYWRIDQVNAQGTMTGDVWSFTTPTNSSNKMKVFILAGQSNMEGQGEINPAATPGTLTYTYNNDPVTYAHLKNGANWAVRDDVWIWYKRDTTISAGGLTTGYGSNTGTIGPELQFGHRAGVHYGQKVLLIKTAWGGKSLQTDFRPPSAGWNFDVPGKSGDQGFYFQEMIKNVIEATANLQIQFPTYNPADGFEFAGFAWHQGWNDLVSPAASAEYEANMVKFIKDLRTAVGVPNLPFVIASSGQSDPTSYSQVELAQLEMDNFTKYPAFNGNVGVVDTKSFLIAPSSSPANEGYHWNRNAKSYYMIGNALGTSMFGLLAETIPPTSATLNPANNATGVAVGTDLVATFSEAIAIGTGNITIKNLTDDTEMTIAVTDTAQVSISGSVLTINPTANLTFGKNYAVQIAATAVKDLANNAFAGIANDTTWNFASVQSPYSAWSSGAAFGSDANGDGVNNGMAWMLGALNPAEHVTAKLPRATRNGANFRLTFRCLKSTKRGSAQLKVQSSNNLGVSDPWTSHEAAVPDTDSTVNGVIFDTTDDGDYINVIADIPSAGQAKFGRLFATSAP